MPVFLCWHTFRPSGVCVSPNGQMHLHVSQPQNVHVYSDVCLNCTRFIRVYVTCVPSACLSNWAPVHLGNPLHDPTGPCFRFSCCNSLPLFSCCLFLPSALPSIALLRRGGWAVLSVTVLGSLPGMRAVSRHQVVRQRSSLLFLL